MQHDSLKTGSNGNNQVAMMREAIHQVVRSSPDFLSGKIDADQMAQTMVHAVRGYLQESSGAVKGRESEDLQEVLEELLGCGSGYLQGLCDAACVRRTITATVREFGH